MATVLIPLPDRDFDVTEVAVPWRLLTRAGHRVVFATERGGHPPSADPLLLIGVIFGKLGADPEPMKFYRELEGAAEFLSPIAWADIEPRTYDGLVLPGGHAQGMRQYLGSATLHEKIAAFFALGRPVGAICHGVIAAARSKDPVTGQSVLAGLRTTCLPRYMERLAYWSTAWKLGKYYRTYPAYVQDEVEATLRAPARQFVVGPITLFSRGTMEDDGPAFVVEDGHYVSARWPGDSYLFTRRFLSRLDARP
jgi:putative intracellular protease/amidase